MKAIRTVLGDIAPEELGVTAAHEHLYCNQHLCRDTSFPRNVEKMQLLDTDLVVNELAPFRELGGRAVVEVTVAGWGRDVSKLADIARRAKIHVIATSGFYVENCLPSYVHSADIETIEATLLKEVLDGADGSNIRTGVLKASVSRPAIEHVEERCCRAVARVHHKTGLAITTHTSGSTRFQIQGGNAGTLFLDLFESEKVDPSRVIIGHCDENADVRQLSALMTRGAYVQFDVIGKSHWLLDETRIDLLVALLDRGHGERLLISSDRNRRSELHVSGGPGYDHVLRKFVPRLKERGVDDEALRRILVTNPARVFSIESRSIH